MRKLFLSSSFSDVADLLPSFLNGIELRGKKVSFIPTGSLRERVTFYVEAGKKSPRETRARSRGNGGKPNVTSRGSKAPRV